MLVTKKRKKLVFNVWTVSKFKDTALRGGQSAFGKSFSGKSNHFYILILHS
jgi:hypothetical protein